MKEVYYGYVGPRELLELLGGVSSRALISGGADVLAWLEAQKQKVDGAGEVVVTFIVDLEGRLWVADRHSEHVVCAAGGPVLAAGEMTFEVKGGQVEVVAVTNQSTGFCPEVESWPSVARALNAMGVGHPGGWTAEFVFRRCEGCGSINLVKEDWYVCGVCDGELAREWNFELMGESDELISGE